MIYHVTDIEHWEAALQKGFFEVPSLHAEGFIHASLKNQVAGVLQRYYSGKNNLVLLHIDESKLTVPLKYELAPSVNEEFPHIYGPLNVDAVTKTELL